MKELISTILHPTVEGLIFLPMILSCEIIEMIFAIIPGKIAAWIWLQADDIHEALSEQVYIAIHKTPNLWSGEWLNDIFKQQEELL